MGQYLTYHGLELYQLEAPAYASPYAVALTGKRGHWRLVVFLRDGGEANVDWDSGSLKRPFQLANSDALALVPKVGEKFGVTFSGCEAKDCSHIFGALLYLPWSHQVFEKDVTLKGIACTENLLQAQNSSALAAIDNALRRQQAANPQYVPPACRQ
ncbi:MAG TPA: hypothetical protein VHX63_09940 [Acidobacteriaceae bacterium]|nr:hypothetical protein [Acidobacteriaceae bacterium]